VPVPAGSAGSAVAASSAFAGPVTVTAATPVLDPVLDPVLAPASAEDEGSLAAEIGAFLPLGYP
jgi:hypothetical protein